MNKIIESNGILIELDSKLIFNEIYGIIAEKYPNERQKKLNKVSKVITERVLKAIYETKTQIIPKKKVEEIILGNINTADEMVMRKISILALVNDISDGNIAKPIVPYNKLKKKYNITLPYGCEAPYEMTLMELLYEIITAANEFNTPILIEYSNEAIEKLTWGISCGDENIEKLFKIEIIRFVTAVCNENNIKFTIK